MITFVDLFLNISFAGTPKSRTKPTPRPTPRPTPAPRIITPRDRFINNIPRGRPVPTERTPVLDIPQICKTPSIDAMTMTKDGQTYLFEGKIIFCNLFQT